MHINILRQAYGKYGMLTGKVDMSHDPDYAKKLVEFGLAQQVKSKQKTKAKSKKDDG